MADALVANRRIPGLPLKAAGGLPTPIGPVDAATGFRKLTPLKKANGNGDDDLEQLQRVSGLSPSLASVLRPQAAYRWLLPYLASITPTYVESVLRGALAGNHVQAWELFDLMIDTDPEIASCVDEYCNGVLNHKIQFEPYHEEDEEPTDQALEKCKLVSAALRNMRPDPANDENALHGTLRDLLFARFHGQSVLEIDWNDSYGSQQMNLRKVPGVSGQVLCPRATYWVHPVCYAWSQEGRLGLRSAINDLRDVTNAASTDRLSMVEPPAWNWVSSQPRPSNLREFPKNKFLITTFKAKAGTALSASCLRPLAWWWVASNFCGDWLLNYAQLFGIPFRKASYPPNTPEGTKTEIKQMLQNCGSAGYILTPTGVEIEFIEGGSSAGQSPQAFLFHFADSQKRKVILHQTMTGGQHDSMGKGGGKAFGEVEADTKENCIHNGARFVAEQINHQLIPMILELNYGVEAAQEDVPSCRMIEQEVGGLVDAQTMQVLSAIVHIPDTFIRRKFGIPKPGPDDEIAGVDQGSGGQEMQNEQSNIEADRKQKDKHAKMQADALAKQPKVMPGAAGAGPKAPVAAPGGDGSRAQAQSDNSDNGVDSRQAGAVGLQAGDVPGHEFHGNQWTQAEESTPLPPIRSTPAQYHLVSRIGPHGLYEATNQRMGGKKLAVHTAGDDLKSHRSFPDKTTAAKWVQSQLDKRNNGGVPVNYSTPDGYPTNFRKWRTISEAEHKENSRAYYASKPVSSRSALEAKAALHAQPVAEALHDTVEPLLKRIDAIAKVPDNDMQKAMMQKLLADMPHITEALKNDDSLAKSLAPAVLAEFVKGLQDKKGS